MEAAQRQRVSDLLDAGIAVVEIAAIVGVHRATVYRIKSKKDANKGIGRVNRSDERRIRTDEFLGALRAEVTERPDTPMRVLARQAGVDEKTIRRAVHEDLGLASYVRRTRHLLTTKQKEARVTRGKKLVNWMKHHSSTVKIFSDKKRFDVDQSRNRQNDRFLAQSPSEVPPIHSTKHPASCMMLGVVASDGKKMPPIWFDGNTRVGQKEYLEVMRDKVKPWVDANYPDGDCVWQQDGAPCHTANKVQDWCRQNLPGFWDKSLWPPSSPDLNPLDYGVWSVVEARACATPHRNVAELRASVDEQWANMSEEFIRNTCRSFRGRVEKVIANDGSHIEN